MHTLVSFLGRGRDNPTSGYREASYRFADGRTATTPFFGLALARHLDPDLLVLLGTESSMWDVLVENLPGIGEADEALRLELMEAVAAGRVTADLLGRAQPLIERAIGRSVRLKLIPFGRDAAEQRQILECIEQAAGRGEVSLDVTHGFRHLPMLSLVSAFVLERLGRTVTGIYYGALEMTADGHTPVLRLDGLLAIQRWVEALAVFDASGDYRVFAPLLAADGVAADKTHCLEEAAFFERTSNVADAARQLATFLPALDAPLPGASGLFQKRLRERLAWAREPDLATRQRKLAHQHLNRGDFVRAAIFGYESLLSRLCLEQGHDPLDYAARERLARAFGEELHAGEHADWKREAFLTLKNLRNALAHGTPPTREALRPKLRDRDKLAAEIQRCLHRLAA
ncbi:TIGR02221 family CRISPR-associated protein [Immundisolibacter sp.]|uniref:TIGR02221 family CRISPR-associated protein n=1 Tax=Immundisolibacter sp. TaxID=1934948 RepID=UPI00261B02A2|nr:TIGR02221 family CRISPR-associated protein [Immundisolibacter sp.]MDD3649937.1 TIGR02221 family CRISPR-associated protein [Immundisolibacter sp.]